LAENGRLQLRVLVDRSSIETFANGGRISLTGCFLPKEGQARLALRATGGVARVRSLVVYELKSSWQ
jgi:sucrose-6-phosphate hydrolase SacC (GH32 family)